MKIFPFLFGSYPICCIFAACDYPASRQISAHRVILLFYALFPLPFFIRRMRAGGVVRWCVFIKIFDITKLLATFSDYFD